jgi:hypothetical protein
MVLRVTSERPEMAGNGMAPTALDAEPGRSLGGQWVRVRAWRAGWIWWALVGFGGQWLEKVNKESQLLSNSSSNTAQHPPSYGVPSICRYAIHK